MGGMKMSEICFYEPWTYQLALPEKIEGYLKFAKKKRISYEAEYCSRYNTRTSGKSAKLHPPTLAAIFKLFGMENNKEEGAAGIRAVRLLHGETKRMGSLPSGGGLPPI